MNNNDTGALLAWALPTRSIIEQLIGCNSLAVNRALAMNRNLSSSQIAKMLSISSIEVGVLLASRLDLTKDQMWSFLKHKSALVRQSFCTRENFSETLGVIDEMAQYAAAQKWFNVDYGNALLSGPSDFTGDQRIVLVKLADPHGERQLRHFSDKPHLPKEKSFRLRSKEIGTIRKNSRYDSYRYNLGVKDLYSITMNEIGENIWREMLSNQRQICSRLHVSKELAPRLWR